MSGFGDPEAVESAATSLRRAAEASELAHRSAVGARPEAWRGKTASAYVAALEKTLPDTLRLAEMFSSAAGTLERYAAAQRNAMREYERAQSDVDQAALALKRNPLDALAVLDSARAQLSAFGAQGAVQQAAAIAATELRALLGEDGDARPWWDPFGWFNDPEDPDERVTDSIMDDEAFDPDDVAQGSIGDCFMLTSVVSLLNTDAGDEFIKQNIRWDPDKEGYWVTLYSNGDAKEVFVEYVFDNGARQTDWEWWVFSSDKPSIAALYEAAIRQEHGYEFLEGGIPAEAMEIITGRTVDVVEGPSGSGLDAEQVSSLKSVLDTGGQVVISSPRTGEHEITVTAADGSSRSIDIVNTHSYAVTRIDADGGVWMRNPWGAGNSADGGGEFRVDADDVSRLFWRATSTNITQ